MSHYVPEPLLGDGNIVEYLQRELQRISNAFDGVTAINLEELNVAPERPRDGMIVLADGTNWNPGTGAGYYGYQNGVWTPLFSAPPHAGLYFSTPVVTTIVTPGIYEKAAGITTPTDLSGFTMPENNRLTFTDPITHHFHIVASISLTTAGVNDTLSIGIAKNGVVLEHSKLSRFIGTGSDIGSIASHADTELATNDYLELCVTNEDVALGITIEQGYLFCMGMRG